jgi:phytoene dehydrogenase-like protein
MSEVCSGVIILGAGPAGLTGAYLLSKEGIPVEVLEADPVYVGGISRTVRYKGFHFAMDRDSGERPAEPAAVLADLLQWQILFLPPESLRRVYDDTYAIHVELLRRTLEAHYPNLHLVSRNGMHKYNNQDHAMMTAMLTARKHHRRNPAVGCMAGQSGRRIPRSWCGGRGIRQRVAHDAPPRWELIWSTTEREREQKRPHLRGRTTP